MSKNLSYKAFMDQVENFLQETTPDILSEMIRKWAKDINPGERNEFLSRLTGPVADRRPGEPDESLLIEIEKLADAVEDGEYANGWGWDDDLGEERDWGDESWADEAGEFFRRALESYLNGHYRLAANAYARLFDILEMGEEPGHLPGNPDQQNMLDTDIMEARSKYIRAVYIASPPDARPAKIWEAMQRFEYCIDDNFSLQSVIDADTEPLPHFAEFLEKWIEFLKNTDSRSTSYLLREAVRLSGGIPAIAKLANEESARFPRAFVDLINALEEKGDYSAMQQAAREGLSAVPRNLAIRSEIAAGFARAGEKLNNQDWQLEGWREAFYSDPSISSFLHLLSISEAMGRQAEEVQNAIDRINSLFEKPRQSQGPYHFVSSELHESRPTKALLGQVYLLSGHFSEACDLYLKIPDPDSDPQYTMKLVIPFLLVLISREKQPRATRNMEQIWEESVIQFRHCHLNTQETKERFEQAAIKVFRSVDLSEEN